MPRVLNVHDFQRGIDDLPPNTVTVMRPSRWGNPFRIGKDCTRDEAVDQFELHLLASPELLADLDELKGKDLVCCCAPKRCHGDVLLKYANR